MPLKQRWREFGFEELRSILACPMKQYGHFKARVLKKACDDLALTDLPIGFKEVKTGRKVTGVIIWIESAGKNKPLFPSPSMSDNSQIEILHPDASDPIGLKTVSSFSHEDVEALIDEAKQYAPKINRKKLRVLIERHGKAYTQARIKMLRTVPGIKNAAAWFMSAMQDEGFVPSGSPPRKRKERETKKPPSPSPSVKETTEVEAPSKLEQQRVKLNLRFQLLEEKEKNALLNSFLKSDIFKSLKVNKLAIGWVRKRKFELFTLELLNALLRFIETYQN